MAYLEELVDAQRRQRSAQDQLKAVGDGKGAGQAVKRQILETQWRDAEEALHRAAEMASQALGLGNTLGHRVEEVPIPAPPIPRIKEIFPPPIPVTRRTQPRHVPTPPVQQGRRRPYDDMGQAAV